jgi:hypothetical protein
MRHTHRRKGGTRLRLPVWWPPWMQMWEIAVAAPQVVAHRTARMMSKSDPTPSTADRKELTRRPGRNSRPSVNRPAPWPRRSSRPIWRCGGPARGLHASVRDVDAERAGGQPPLGCEIGVGSGGRAAHRIERRRARARQGSRAGTPPGHGQRQAVAGDPALKPSAREGPAAAPARVGPRLHFV